MICPDLFSISMTRSRPLRTIGHVASSSGNCAKRLKRYEHFWLMLARHLRETFQRSGQNNLIRGAARPVSQVNKVAKAVRATMPVALIMIWASTLSDTTLRKA